MDCLFCKIVAGKIPSEKVYEDENVLAFKDINPQAPVHILVIPKSHIEGVDALNGDTAFLVGLMFKVIPKIAAKAGLKNGYRVVSNVGEDGCQSVRHLHFHILGGTKLGEKMA